MLPYPRDLPLDDVRNIVDAIRTRNLQGQTPVLAKSVWVLVGYGLGQTVGEPGGPNVFSCNDPNCPHLSHDEVADSLELLLAPEGVVGVAIPWAAIIKWGLALLTQLI